ncbi:hypothetical protein JTE90_006908 [Oedothorax gibbosus]|uniref:Uncharacterized protein n=1 Tax=Oedothorax gibbosus TaxID=931172 RepID=A0AAV6VNC3_9ARAC|nr:hypothetical protein JTE90_006908 [Oedothorax gibbosus]
MQPKRHMLRKSSLSCIRKKGMRERDKRSKQKELVRQMGDTIGKIPGKKGRQLKEKKKDAQVETSTLCSTLRQNNLEKNALAPTIKVT